MTEAELDAMVHRWRPSGRSPSSDQAWEDVQDLLAHVRAQAQEIKRLSARHVESPPVWEG